MTPQTGPGQGIGRMRAVRVNALSEDITAVDLEEIDLPDPGEGEVQIRIRACAVNFPDLLMVQGKYQFKPPMPFTPGMEAAGDIVAVGSGVTQFAVGDKVVAGLRTGGMAEGANTAAAGCRRMPEAMSYEEAAGYTTAYLSADVVYDPVGGDVFDESVRCIAWGGRLLVIGFASGRIPDISVNMPLIKGFSVVGVRAGEYGRKDPAKGAENIAAIDEMATKGTIRPYVHASFPLDKAAEAMCQLRDRQVIGKVVVTP
jgi:NADPH:quinone reductase-like Zn-dependent oxidoreductase